MQIQRLTDKPIISTTTHPQAGDNINGPSLIRMPEWVIPRLGKYYLYFGHHNGKHIGLAFADSLAGPWRIHDGGVLPLANSGFQGHIASPDVHIDEQQQRILMYFHGSDSETDAASPQYTRLAASVDGLEFKTITDNLGGAYWRVFHWCENYYALEMPGRLLRADNAHGPFASGPAVFLDRMRHSAVAQQEHNLDVFYSNIGDCPESILHTSINLSGDWMQWSTDKITTVATPTGQAEGSECRLEPSRIGIATGPVNELRDPASFEENGRRYLLFSVAGEQGIAIAILKR